MPNRVTNSRGNRTGEIVHGLLRQDLWRMNKNTVICNKIAGKAASNKKNAYCAL